MADADIRTHAHTHTLNGEHSMRCYYVCGARDFHQSDIAIIRLFLLRVT